MHLLSPPAVGKVLGNEGGGDEAVRGPDEREVGRIVRRNALAVRDERL